MEGALSNHNFESRKGAKLGRTMETEKGEGKRYAGKRMPGGLP